MELYINLDFISLYADSIELQADIPTWLIVATIGLVYSIRIIRKEK